MSPRRLALVATELAVGGAERCLTTLACGLPREEFAPMVYSLAPAPSGERAALVHALQDAGVPVRFVGAARSRQLRFAVRELRAMLREQSPAIVQSFLFHANVATALALGKNGPTHFAGARVAQPRPWRLRVERWATRRVRKMVCVSQAVADFYRERAGFDFQRLEVIPNGIDVERIGSAAPADLRQFGIPAGASAIVAVGRLDPQKGFDWLLDQARKLLSDLTDHHLLIVGDGPERETLRSQAARISHLRERTHFVGWRNDVPSILRACRIFVLTSRYEGMPNALLEAMAAGLPVVARRVEGVTELLGKNADEQSVAPGDGAGFRKALLHFAHDSAHARLLGEQNAHRARHEFSIEVMLERYCEMYRGAFEDGSKRSAR